jgi:sterol desaturase/sphingolipid hydroxylase (fatty acid hydroxylase superfamily)
MLDALRATLDGLPPLLADSIRYSNGLLLLAAVFLPLERLFARQTQPIGRAGWRTDVGYYFLTSLLAPRLVLAALALLLLVLHRLAPAGLFPQLAELPTAPRFALALLVAETGFYWGHRAMHAHPWLWRFHAVHHSAEQMDWLVNTRAHPLDLVFTRLCGLLPLYLLGLVRTGSEVVDATPLLVTLLASTWGYLIHANLRWRFGICEHVLATPAFHHQHHARLADGDREHGNYAAMLPLMDHVFGTWRTPEPAGPARYGTDEPVPPHLIDQLMAPFMGGT